MKNNTKKIFGAVLSATIYLIFYLGMMGYIIYLSLYEDSTPGWIIVLIVLSIICISMIVNLINRIKEIKGGEEDEASKY